MKHMRLPNGFGQISEIRNKKLRNKFRAMVTVGYDEDHYVRKIIGYYHTYNDAYTALLKYHEDPYSDRDIKLCELYEQWMGSQKRTDSTDKYYRTAWNHCKPLHDKSIRSIRAAECQNIITNPNLPKSQHAATKLLLKQLFDYAIMFDYCDKNYAQMIKVPTIEQEHHTAYTEEELNIIAGLDDNVSRFVLVSCYSGWRPNELLNIEIDENIMYGGSKTNSGKNRMVPICEKIKGLVPEKWKWSSYQTLYNDFAKWCDKYHFEGHKLHDGRKTFATMCKKAGVDEYAIKRMMGHRINDLTERVYTERGVDWLIEEINKI